MATHYRRVWPKIIYIKGKHNIVTDALSQLDLAETEIHIKNLGEVLNFKEELPQDSFPLTYFCIAREQQTIIAKAVNDKIHSVNSFHGGEKQWDLATFV